MLKEYEIGIKMVKSQMYKIVIQRFMLNILQMLQSFVIAIPLGVLGAIIIFFIVKRYQNTTGEKLEKKKQNAIILLVSYITIIVQMAILFRPWGTIHEIDWIPFDMYGGVRYIVLYAVANAVVFLPIGILLPMVWTKMDRWKTVLLGGFLGSLFIELSQLFLQCGIVQTEDLIMNTIGTGIGFGIYKKGNHLK